MQERVLIVTGGLITSEERSLFEAARKLSAQWSIARAAWLDRKVKLVMAESLLAMQLEKAMLFLRPKQIREELQSFFADRANTEAPSLTEVLLATLLDQAGMPYELMTLDILFADPRRAERLIDKTTCVFLSTTYLHDLSEVQSAITRLKRPHNSIVMGGALAGIICHQWEGTPEVDVLAIGYGELLVDSLVAWIRSGYKELEPPPGGRLMRKKHTRFLYSGVPDGEDLDFLTVPDWGLAERNHCTHFKMIYYESVRGCPYRCNFCNYPYLFDDARFRYKSAAKMADDWSRYADELGVEYITCLDSLFTMPRKRLREFCRLLIERRIVVRWICYARADDLADEETVQLMKEAGAHQVQIGIETGDATLLKNMNKVCTVEANSRALANCRKYGLTSLVSLIVGFPGETTETLERTYQFLESSPPDFYFLATFSTRVAGVPLLEPANKQRFGLQVMNNLHSMAPYWRHNSMSCTEVGDQVRALDRRIMREKVALNAALFYPWILAYSSRLRDSLLHLQQRAASRHPALRVGFNILNRWVNRRLKTDVSLHFGDGSRSSTQLPKN